MDSLYGADIYVSASMKYSSGIAKYMYNLLYRVGTLQLLIAIAF